MKTIGDQQLLKRINRSVLLRLLRAQPGLSRARLATESGLTKSTVSGLVRELIDDRWLTEAGATVADGLGRPSTPLSINDHVRALIGVEIGVETMRVVCVSLLGAVLRADARPLDSKSPLAACQQAASMCAQAWAHMNERGLELTGIGVGVPGAVDDATGIVLFAPNLGWRGLDLLPDLIEAFAAAGLPRVPVQLQNEADVAALGEYEFCEGEGEDPLIFVDCDVGVGAGIVLNDRLFTGAQGMAGEIGHTILQADGPLCSCGRRGCAEAFFGSRVLGGEPGEAARAGRMLGVLLQNLWITFDPHAIVIGGSTCLKYPEFLQCAIDTVQAYAEAAGMPPPVVRGARHGQLAPAVGAAALALHDYLRPMHPNTVTRREQAAPQLHAR
ncbi:ROK family transcriptional regulator [Variovorax sp. J22R133]|uniref:ROK family transcriptional regulator n=1 Tax=Variovorax brevis TaxID=3053503 RepID=UPI002578763E|nr:ROK family transcriptional regulator [Variovorax sp. J22R133]MDM0115803.1 ROK family transcriptional regulator [Variovorax sp. J22R133]